MTALVSVAIVVLALTFVFANALFAHTFLESHHLHRHGSGTFFAVAGVFATLGACLQWQDRTFRAIRT